jgi:ABC-type uncharacterized transport system permease subunit
MSRLEPEDDVGNPWMAILLGVVLLVLAWYINTKLGTDFKATGRAALVNSSWGRKVSVGLIIFVGVGFIVLGVTKLRSDK